MIVADDFLSVAENLTEAAESCEATRRTAISRAYYGAFHGCQKLCNELDCWLERTMPPHEKVIESLLAAQDPELRRQGNRLKEMKAVRVVSDYRLADSISMSDMRQQLKKSRRILAESDQYLQFCQSNGSNP